MIQFIALVIFLASLSGVLFILYRKIPVLALLPKNGHHGIKKHKAIIKLEKRLKEFNINFFHKQVYLHKALSRMRILVLKIERKIGDLLHSIRKNAQEVERKVKKKK